MRSSSIPILFAILIFHFTSTIAQDQAIVEINSFLNSGVVKQGTGFFFSEDSRILTSYHVIEGYPS